MKRIGDLYGRITSMDNIYLAHEKARKGKRHYSAVRQIDSNPDQHLTNLWRVLVDGEYRTSQYTIITRRVGQKTRVIFKLPYYPDRIVHHCIMNVLEPIWYKTLIRDTYSAIKGRGVHDGVKRIKHFLNDKPGTRYCLKVDVKQFYPSINHDVLKQIIEKKIKCPGTLCLLNEIIDSAPGVPIGNYLSQYFGNLYLSYFDHFCKEVIGIRYYARYCDDIVMFSDNKPFLHGALESMKAYLSRNLALTLNGNYQIFPTRVRGVDFLGYRFFGDYTLVRKSIAKKFKKRMKAATMQTGKTTSSVMSYKGWLGHANAHRLWGSYAPAWCENKNH